MTRSKRFECVSLFLKYLFHKIGKFLLFFSTILHTILFLRNYYSIFKPEKRKTVNHHREWIYTSCNLKTSVCLGSQMMEALSFSFYSLFFTCVVHIAIAVNWKQSLQENNLVVCRLLLSCCFLFSKSNLYLSLYVHFINRLVLRVRISWNSSFYCLFYMICMSLDMISISQRAIHFHPSISIKANGINSHYSEQPRTVTSSYKYAAPKKDEKAKPFRSNYLKV